jgi:hypothetical protein
MNKGAIKEFLDRLEGPEGCNFHEDPARGLVWKCAGGRDQSLSRAILKAMGIRRGEAKTFLKRCYDLGGHCDCEILFNAADHLEET